MSEKTWAKVRGMDGRLVDKRDGEGEWERKTVQKMILRLERAWHF